MELFVRSFFIGWSVVLLLEVLAHPEIKTVAKARATKAINLFITENRRNAEVRLHLISRRFDARGLLLDFAVGYDQ